MERTDLPRPCLNCEHLPSSLNNIKYILLYSSRDAGASLSTCPIKDVVGGKCSYLSGICIKGQNISVADKDRPHSSEAWD